MTAVLDQPATTTPAPAPPHPSTVSPSHPLSSFHALSRFLTTTLSPEELAHELKVPPRELRAALSAPESRDDIAADLELIDLRDRYQSALRRARLLERLDHLLARSDDLIEIRRACAILARLLGASPSSPSRHAEAAKHTGRTPAATPEPPAPLTTPAASAPHAPERSERDRVDAWFNTAPARAADLTPCPTRDRFPNPHSSPYSAAEMAILHLVHNSSRGPDEGLHRLFRMAHHENPDTTPDSFIASFHASHAAELLDRGRLPVFDLPAPDPGDLSNPDRLTVRIFPDAVRRPITPRERAQHAASFPRTPAGTPDPSELPSVPSESPNLTPDASELGRALVLTLTRPDSGPLAHCWLYLSLHPGSPSPAPLHSG